MSLWNWREWVLGQLHHHTESSLERNVLPGDISLRCAARDEDRVAQEADCHGIKVMIKLPTRDSNKTKGPDSLALGHRVL